MNRISRRQKFCFVLFLIVACLSLAGCSIQWVSEATGIIAALVPAINAILLLLTAAGAAIPAESFSEVQAASQEAIDDLNNVVLPLIEQYNNSLSATEKSSILTRISDAIAVVITNYGKILPALHIDDAGVQAKIEALVGAVQAELQSLLALIPVLQGTKSMAQFHEEGHMVPFNHGQFRHLFQHLLKGQTGNLAFDAALEQVKL